MALVDLPEIDVLSGDVQVTLNNFISVYEALTESKLYPGNPVRLLFNTVAAIIVQQRELIDLMRKSNLLRYASGAALDHIGAFSGTTRLPAEFARTSIRFSLSAGRQVPVTIPAGTRISTESDPKRYFETTIAANAPVGALNIDVPAAALEPGAQNNGLLAGQINQIVDPVAYVASASNTTISSGGANIEDDDSYRLRIQEAPEAFSVAGPEGAYKFWAKTANSSIVDVAVHSPTPSDIVLVPLLIAGGIPGQSVLDQVTAICSDKRVRPLTDRVSAAAPTVVNYTIAFTYWIDRDREVEIAAIQTAVAQAVQDYINWQRSKLGRNINRSELIRRLVQAGASRVDVTNPPQNGLVGTTQVAIVSGTPAVTYGGLDDD
ncbi:baseplate assembly protein [Paenibacillus xanthanilyticus]|uniref:Baseplate J/gp47 family protein n=1 Tax=Paenibacillus xanthanilyticus TaxID=1783531 RepID=A0ABV8KAH8_9BACL